MYGSALQREAIVCVRIGKLVFPQQQLKQVVIMLVGRFTLFFIPT